MIAPIYSSLITTKVMLLTMNHELGSIIKGYRKDRQMTLQSLADATGLSVSYLSLLERGMNSPTLENLNKICAALKICMSNLISQLDAKASIVTHANERRVIFDGKGFLYESASEGKRQLSCVVMTIYDNRLHLSNAHVADEIGFIVSGSLHFTVSGEQYDMGPGDCIYIEANNNHSYQKTSTEDCVSIWVYGLPNPPDTLPIAHDL